MFNSMTPPPVSSYGEPCCLRPLPSQGAPGMGTEGQYIRQSLDLDQWQTSHPAPGLPLLSRSSFPYTRRLEVPCHMGLGLTWGFRMDCMRPSFPCSSPAVSLSYDCQVCPSVIRPPACPAPPVTGQPEMPTAAWRVRPQAACLPFLPLWDLS